MLDHSLQSINQISIWNTGVSSSYNRRDKMDINIGRKSGENLGKRRRGGETKDD
jgi:hypothetical protein